jgi:4-hydroxybenzoate polyprenyltransferase
LRPFLPLIRPLMNKSQKISAYLRLMRFHKPVGILLLLWPTLWALWIASGGVPQRHILCVFVLGVILMRAAGCVINDIADRHWDGAVTRSQQRPLVTGEIHVRSAFILFIGLILLALVLVLTLNKLTIGLAGIAVVIALIYPFLKRYTHWPQFGLGIAFSMSVLMAFAAVTGDVPWVSGLLFLAVVFWTMAYDTMYAMADRPDDLKIGIKSTAVLFGQHERLAIGVMQIMTVGLLVGLGISLSLSCWYYAGSLAALGFMLYQHRLIARRDPLSCLRAFTNNQWLGLVVFLGILMNYIFK